MLSLMPMMTDSLAHDVLARAMMHDLVPSPGLAFAARDAPRLVDQDTHYALSLSAPGVSARDLSVSVTGNVLKIVGESKSHRHSHVVNWQTTIPKNADADAATAETVDGVVHILIPKKAAEAIKQATTRAIAVSAEPEETPSDDEDDAYTLTLPAPGIAASDLSIHFEAGLLKVSGESKRTGARVERVFRAPRDADVVNGNVAASHVDGMLTIVLPKKPAPVTKIIAVNQPAGAALEQQAAAADEEELAQAPSAAPVDKEDAEMI